MPQKHIKTFRFIAIFSGILLLLALLLDIAVYGTWKDLLRPHILSFDGTIIESIRIHTSEALSRLMILITECGSISFYVTVGGIIVIGLCLKRKVLEGIMLVVCSGGSGLMTLLLKEIVMRIRPDMMPLITETGYSFPSGHSVTAVCFYGYLAFLCWSLGRSQLVRRGSIIAAVCMILGIGISRIYLGVHFPTDVIGGYVGGLMWLSLSILVLDYVKQKKLP
ncbi:MAG: phosphatase PAP2 family protein [Selenomonadales bacterium]|nr:phosphatase PAP2 family protein [Selenomonadales bacterium]